MRLLAFFLLILSAHLAHAQKPSYHLANPVGWMYQLPKGEQPGWAKSFWFNFEANHASIWNSNFSMTDRRTGDVYTYKADFEQTSAIINVGGAVTNRLAFSLEIPYLNRNGGFLDGFIDQFHDLIGSSRFLRNVHRMNQNSYVIQKNGVNALASEHGEGVAALVPKVKYWVWKKQSPKPGACDCGLAVGAQAKFPTRSRRSGLTNGSPDFAGAVYLGVPINRESGIWVTGAFTKLGANENFSGWPLRKWAQMYEVAMDIGISGGFGWILGGRLESPLMEKQYLSFNYTTTLEENQRLERMASAWNSFTQWRGSQSFGPRWRWPNGNEINLLILEDWGVGRCDNPKDWTYSNNAPDVSFVSQLNIHF